MDNRIPDLLLERLALGELPAEQEASVRARLAANVEAQARLREIEGDRPAFLAAHPVAPATREIERRAGILAWRRRRVWRIRTGVGLAAPAMAVAALVVIIGRVDRLGSAGHSGSGTGGEAVEDTRLKGLSPSLVVFRKGPPGAPASALADGAEVRAHDVLQAGYVAAGRRYGALVSLDGAGQVTVHSPSPGQPPRLEPSGRVLLSAAYELDDAPGFERFFLVTSTSPFALDEVLAAVDRLARQGDAARTSPLPLPERFAQASLLLRRASPSPRPAVPTTHDENKE